MTNEEIHNLAKRITSDLYEEDFEKDIYGALKWLSDRYEIVSKERLREAICNIRDAYANGDNDMVEAYLEELENLFP